MRSERRLAKLEASLPPREAVLHWLTVVHGHGSLANYMTSLLDQPASKAPAIVITDRAAAAARAAHAGEPRPVIREAERRAISDAVFLFMLVIELEHDAAEIIRIGTLRLGALSWEHRARTAEGAADRKGWNTWRAGVLDLATDVARSEAVRRILEDSHFNGREVLFPVALAAWAELQEGVAALVSESQSGPGSRRWRPDREVAREVERTAAQAAAILVERVRARTLDVLGDHAGACVIAERARSSSSTS